MCLPHGRRMQSCGAGKTDTAMLSLCSRCAEQQGCELERRDPTGKKFAALCGAIEGIFVRNSERRCSGMDPHH
jgi:hypothetical protein